MHYIVNPGRLCHRKAAAVHGYSDWLLCHQQPFSDVVDNIVGLIEKADLVVAHNIAFDISFINAELKAASPAVIAKPSFCTMQAYRRVAPGRSARLDDVAAEIGLSRAGSRHGALEDAWLVMMVYFNLHKCPYRAPFSVISNSELQNLRPAPPMAHHRCGRPT
jgi:DNA polymerase-3 subunit epsilon